MSIPFGEYDVVAIFELSDNVRQAAISMAIVAGGAAKAVKTIPLLTWEEGIEAMRTAADTVYRPPSNSLLKRYFRQSEETEV